MFNVRLKELRNSKKLTQKQIFTSIDMSERNYQGLEYGEAKPSYENLIKLADYFEVSLDYIVGRTDNPKVNK